MSFCILFSTVLLILAPAEAWAWGVGVHLQIGSHILDNLHLVAPSIQSLIKACPYDYLYGCISADITLGKKFTHYLQHCHSWRMGRRILDAAETDAQRACAFGYLTHLGADTVAHSYFVPYKMVRTFNTLMLKHAYWEMRFESEVPAETWSLARKIARKDFSTNDALMRNVLSDTIFSFNTNKRLFNSLLLLNRLQQWQKMLRSLSTSSRWTLGEEDRMEYMGLSKQAAESVMGDWEASPFLMADPTGERAINAARTIRKNLNLLWLDGKLPEGEAEAILAELRPRFRQGITRPEEILQLLSVM